MPRRGAKDWFEEAKGMPDVWRWYESRCQGGAETGSVYLRAVMRTLHEFGTITPPDLLKFGQKKLDDFMQDYVAFFLAKQVAPGRTMAGSTVSKYVDAVKDWLDYNDVELKRKLRIPGANENPIAEAQQTPDQDLLGQLFIACDLRTAAIAAMEAFAGVRPGVLGKTDSREDALRLADLPDLELDGGLSFARVPAQINVRRSISKTKKPYITFLGPQGCEIILAYLRSRVVRGERLDASSPLLVPATGPPRLVHRNNLQDCLRMRMVQVSVEASTYISRSYFASRMVIAESQANVPNMYSQYWMGHNGSMMSRYALGKNIPPDAVEDMRAAYSRAVPFLETRKSASPDDPKVPIYEALLLVSGFSSDEVKAINVAEKSSQELAAMASERLRPLEPRGTSGGARPAARQKVVAPPELDAALTAGWTVKTELHDGRIVIESP